MTCGLAEPSAFLHRKSQSEVIVRAGFTSHALHCCDSVGGKKNIIPLFNSVNDIKKKKDTFPFSFWSLLKIRASLAASGGFWKPLSLECVQAGLSTLDPVPGTTWLLRWQEVCDPSYSLACLRKEMFGAKWSRVPAFIEHLQTMRATGSQSFSTGVFGATDDSFPREAMRTSLQGGNWLPIGHKMVSARCISRHSIFFFLCMHSIGALSGRCFLLGALNIYAYMYAYAVCF